MSKNLYDPNRLALVAEQLRLDPAAGERTISKTTGLPRASVARMLRHLRNAGASTMTARTKVVENSNVPEPGARSNPDGSFELVTSNPCTLEDLLKACRVDTSTWRVARWVANKWEVGAKQKNGSIDRTPLFQIKAWLERIPGLEESTVVRETLEWIKRNRWVPANPVAPAAPRKLEAVDSYLLEISVPDLHHGKLTWGVETGEDYDSTISARLHQEAVENLWRRASPFPVDRILLVVGNDFFNVNSAANTTAAGTPQQEDGRWAKTFRTGVTVLRNAIEFLRGKAPGGVEVRVIRGNHDSERIFMAGEVLSAMYAGVDGVHVVNEPAKRQYIAWGCVLLGLGHGDGVRHDKLPLIMAGEAPELWAATTHREWHLGHYHHKRETQFHAGNEYGPVRVRILPSLTTADEWHYVQGFVGARRAAESYLWSKLHGYVGHFSWSPSSL